jgi:hypothetical protein
MSKQQQLLPLSRSRVWQLGSLYQCSCSLHHRHHYQYRHCLIIKSTGRVTYQQRAQYASLYSDRRMEWRLPGCARAHTCCNGTTKSSRTLQTREVTVTLNFYRCTHTNIYLGVSTFNSRHESRGHRGGSSGGEGHTVAMWRCAARHGSPSRWGPVARCIVERLHHDDGGFCSMERPNRHHVDFGKHLDWTLVLEFVKSKIWRSLGGKLSTWQRPLIHVSMPPKVTRLDKPFQDWPSGCFRCRCVELSTSGSEIDIPYLSRWVLATFLQQAQRISQRHQTECGRPRRICR